MAEYLGQFVVTETHEILSDEEVAIRLFRSAQTRSKRREIDFDIELCDVLERVQKGICEATGVEFDRRAGKSLPFRASIDRIDNEKGYIKGNIQIVCRIYNTAKWTWNHEDVMKMAYALMSRG